MTTGADVWHPIPTRANRSAPPETASAYAKGLAEYVYRLPAAARTSLRVLATPGTARQPDPSPSNSETRAASMRSCSRHHINIADTTPPS